MAIQKFADWGTEFNTDNIKGQIHWGEFIEALKAGKKARVTRLRFLADYVGGGQVVADLSYCYVMIDGDIYDCSNFPIHNWYGRRANFKRDLYKLAKSEGVFIPGLFENLSFFI